MEELGCGEVFLNSIDKDGSGEGFDLDLKAEDLGMTDEELKNLQGDDCEGKACSVPNLD